MARGIMRPGGRHTIVCKHWLRDLCMKGDKCDFLHQYDLARMPECVQWSRFGKCPDNDCDFRHDTEKMECQKYKFGFCKLGSQCRMRHDKLGRAYLPEVIPDWYLKEIIPNFFDFVPRLPEEVVRVTAVEEHHLPPPFMVQPIPAPVAMPWQVPSMGVAGPWAAADAAWVAPPVQQPVVDLTEERAPKRPAPARQLPDTRRRPSPDARPETRRRDDRPVPEPRKEDRKVEERRRDDDRKVDDRRREDERNPRSRDRKDEPTWWERQVQRGPERRRSRTPDRRRDDRGRTRR